MGLRKQLRCNKRRGGLFHVVPWINVLLVLFLYYVVQQQRLVSPGVTISLPDAAADGGAPIDSEVVTVLRDGIIFYRDEKLSPEKLLPALRAGGTVRSTLLIEADGSVPNATLVRVYEAARTAGFRQVVLATRLRAASP
jgi:biopolymer transport protein ExbD